ncbi:MAG TPA: ATP-binding protein [Myxococcota bacterium]|nr:ATP-binding protein [Myxococcota bacterium]
MGIYTALLSLSSFVGALCAGYILAQSPRQRATQLAALLAATASWWALCESRWNAAADAAEALHWMRLSGPGWVFLGGMVPHLMARYLDIYPVPDAARRQRILMRAALVGYAVGLAVMPFDWWTRWVHAAIYRTPWGWSYAPGTAQLVYFGAVSGPVSIAVVSMVRNFHSPLSVATRSHRIAIRFGILTPIALTPLTDIILPALGISFPRLGSTSYTIFGLIALGTAFRFGMLFFTPQQFSEEILDALHEGVGMITPSGLVRRANRGLAHLCGREPSALVGLELRALLDWSPPTAPRAVDEEKSVLWTADRVAIPVSVSAAPLRDRQGEAMGVVVVVRDLREVEELRRRMLIQARLAAVGELAAGLAHEINNPLAFVRSNLAQLERRWKMLVEPEALCAEEREAIGEESRELIADSLTGVDRAAAIVRGVRHFTHAGHPAREPANLNELLDDAISMLRPRLHPPELAIELRAGEIPPVACAPQELRQVFLNLLVNALDAVGESGRVVVTTLREGDAVVAEVRDDGCGMSPETLERIFDPFFTTKRVGEGTGLGLGIAWHIVQKHGGEIAVESAPGSGSSFRVRLPLHGATAEAA